jgi:hypothetical protein
MKTAIIDTPAKERVIAALERYKQTDADLQDYRATSSKAEVEEQKGLDDPKLTEQEAADKISRAQNLKSVYAAREGGKSINVRPRDSGWRADRFGTSGTPKAGGAFPKASIGSRRISARRSGYAWIGFAIRGFAVAPCDYRV